ncbi:MAG: hypothetical protein GKR99_13805 [Rhodobacteraceae bacterium]|nr:hypothetical protein [Paracoccaceae bacterium]
MAVKVTEVCDGHGLLAAWLVLAMVWKGPRPTRAAIRWLLAGVVAIQAFNLARIIILAATIATSPGTFEFMHLTVFPLATALLMVTLKRFDINLRHIRRP